MISLPNSVLKSGYSDEKPCINPNDFESFFLKSCLIHQAGNSLLVFSLLFTTATALKAADVTTYAVVKSEHYVQSGPETVSRDSTNRFVFQAGVMSVSPANIGSCSVILPTEEEFELSPSDGLFDLSYTSLYPLTGSSNQIQSLAEFDANYPNGEYTLRVSSLHDGTILATVNLTNEAYRSIPQVSNFSAAQNANASLDFTLEWFPFTGGTTNDYISVAIVDGSKRLYQSPLPGSPGALDGTSTSCVIPANLLYQNRTYQLRICFWKVVSINRDDYPGAIGYGAYAVETRVNLQTPGFVVGWGSQSAPVGLNGVTAISAGGSPAPYGEEHSLAVKSDTTVVAWGDNTYGQCEVPPGLSGVVAVAAGESHSLALKYDGTVVAWGDNTWGQCSVPNGLNGVVSIAAEGSYSLALKSDGTVVSWGFGLNGANTVPAGLTGVVAIAAGGFDAYDHSLALKSDGTVVAWGDRHYGESTVPVGLNGVIAIAAGGHQSLALKNDGTVVTWGHGGGGIREAAPPGLTNVVAITAGLNFALALKQDGTVVGWGDNQCGQIAIPEYLRGVVGITAAGYHCLALMDSVAPSIVSQPESQCASSGSNVVLSITVSGSPPLSYQWSKDGVPLYVGGPSMVISNVQASHQGAYTVTVTNSAGAVTSTVAYLTVETQTSALNTIAYFNGSKGSLVVTNGPDVREAEAITLEAWLCPMASQTERSSFISCGNTDLSDATVGGYELDWVHGWVTGIDEGVEVRLSLGESSWTALGANLPEGEWVHVAATYNSNIGVFQLFINGRLAASTRYSTTGNGTPGDGNLAGLRIRQTQLPVYFGCCSLSNDFAHGYIDEIRIWNRALSQSEIQRQMWYPLTGLEPGLIAYWNFENGTGDDVTGLDHTAILSGTADISQVAGSSVIRAGCVSPLFTGIVVRTNCPVLLLTGPTDKKFRIDTSSNLVDWSPWSTYMNLTGSIKITGPPGTKNQSRQFFRAVMQ